MSNTLGTPSGQNRRADTHQPTVAKIFPINPAHPERICWGCDKYCPTDALACGNGSGRTLHPAEMLGEDWYTFGDWGLDIDPETDSVPPTRDGT